MSPRERLVVCVWLLGAGCVLPSCSEPAASAPVATEVVTAAPDAAPVPHGDHNPHYGGLVFMHGELHFEVVLDRLGTHRVYFSDATRVDLPAATASSVTITVTRPGRPDETLTAGVDENGESWIAHGTALEGEVTARVAFATPTGPYWIDIPYDPLTTSAPPTP